MAGKKLYVGNLNYSVTNKDLEDLFSEYGKVDSVNVIEGKGFGFVEMADDAQAEKAVWNDCVLLLLTYSIKQRERRNNLERR